MIVTTGGCKKTDTADNSPIKQPVVENNTAVVEFTSVDANGKEIEASTVVNTAGDFVNYYEPGIPLSKKIATEEGKAKFEKKAEDYQVSKKKLEEVENNAEKWETFSYLVLIANTTGKRMAFEYITVDRDDDLIVDTGLGCEYGIGPGNAESIEISGLVNTEKYKDEAAVKEALKALNVQLKYTYVANEDETVDDWSKADVHYSPITIS